MAVDGSYLYDAVNNICYAWNRHIRLLPGESIFAIVNAAEMPENLEQMPSNFIELTSETVTADDNDDIIFELPEISDKRIFIEFEQNIGVMEVNCNGKDFAPLFAPPYRVEISSSCKKINSLSIKFTKMPEVETDVFDYEMPRRTDMKISVMQAD